MNVRFARAGLILPVLLFLALFYAYPLWKILTLGLSQAMQDASSLAQLVSSTYHARILLFTFWQATLSSLLTVVLALPGAFLLARFDFPGKSMFEAMVTVPFVLPTVVVATAFQTLADPDCLVGGLMALAGLPDPDLRHGLGLILAAHVFYNFSLALRLIGSFWAHLDPALTEAARVAGSTPWRAFRTVSLPLLAPAVASAGLLTFIFCFSSFGVVLLLGGSRYATLEVEIYRQAVHIFNLPLAATLSIIQLVMTWAVMRTQAHFQSRCARPLAARSRVRPLGQARLGLRIWARLYLGLAALLLILPLVSLAAESLRVDQAWSLRSYTALLENPRGSFLYVPPLAAMGNSLLYALTATALAVPLGLCAAASVHTRTKTARIFEPLLMLPMTTSAVTLGFGFIIALDRPPLNLRSSWVLVPVAHALVAFPFVMRTVLPALEAVPRQLREAASTLGAAPWRIRRTIDLPLLSKALLLGGMYAFVISLGEFGATLFIARPHTPTLPLAIYRFLSLPGSQNHGQAMAMSTILMLVCVACFLGLERAKNQIWGKF